jgi:hypothetical protein
VAPKPPRSSRFRPATTDIFALAQSINRESALAAKSTYSLLLSIDTCVRCYPFGGDHIVVLGSYTQLLFVSIFRSNAVKEFG